MQTLIIVRGPPGSGKSTFVKKLISELPEGETSAHFEADMYHYDKDGNYNWNPDNLSKAHNWCYASVRNALEHNVDNVYVSNTFIKLRDIKRYLDLSSDVVVYRMCTQFDNIHSVPPEVVKRMTDTYQPYEKEIEIK
jgi:tRNA uridine 5-carbamoylmethylation protein Kti12